jgi:hypothetical protein
MIKLALKVEAKTESTTMSCLPGPGIVLIDKSSAQILLLPGQQ